MKVLIKCATSPFSGYGNDGMAMARALMRLGADVYLQPAHCDPPLPLDIAALLTKRLEAPFDLLIHHVSPDQLGLTPEARKAAKFTMAWTMWENSSLDNMQGRSKTRKNLQSYDLVVGYDAVSTAALKPYVGSKTKTATLQGGYWSGEWPAAQRDWFSDRFGFCMNGQLHERKDPWVAIQAFRELKQEQPLFEGAELHLKTTVPGLHPQMEEWIPKLRIHYDVWPKDVLYQFYAAQHVLLAPSRGEGKNLPALEFMSTGGTVIATNWGGHQVWLRDDYAYPLDYQLRPIHPKFPNCHNARASKDHLKKLMWHVYTNRGEARRKGELAASTIPAMCDWDKVFPALWLLLGGLSPEGRQVQGLAARCFPTASRSLAVG